MVAQACLELAFYKTLYDYVCNEQPEEAQAAHIREMGHPRLVYDLYIQPRFTSGYPDESKQLRENEAWPLEKRCHWQLVDAHCLSLVNELAAHDVPDFDFVNF